MHEKSTITVSVTRDIGVLFRALRVTQKSSIAGVSPREGNEALSNFTILGGLGVSNLDIEYSTAVRQKLGAPYRFTLVRCRCWLEGGIVNIFTLGRLPASSIGSQAGGIGSFGVWRC